jgi:hypothetical protein
MDMRTWHREWVLDFYKLLLAIFLFVSPWLFVYASGTAIADLRASGAAVAVISVAAIVAFAKWEEWALLLMGLWLIVSPWVLDFPHTRAMHLSIGIGIVVSFLAALELWLAYDAAHPELPPSEAKEKR